MSPLKNRPPQNFTIVNLDTLLLNQAKTLLGQFNQCILWAPLESTFMNLHSISLRANPYANIVHHTDMNACHSKPVHNNLTVHHAYQRQVLSPLFHMSKINTIYSIHIR